MRKILMGFLAAGILFSLRGNAFAGFDMTGKWLLEGGGYAEKGILRVELKVDGYMDLLTKTEGDTRYVTGYLLKAKLNASKLGINAWDYSDNVTLKTPIPVPDLEPTLNKPFELPAVTVDGLTYKITFTSTASGSVKIYGNLDVDKVGNVEINSESAIWKEGTEKPYIKDESSGCNAGVLPLLAVLFLFPRMLKIKRK